ncbi:heavy metal translocating P-type ATPase [Nitratiruptor sp. SB155-2]|uniref:heavy metal translocating P-type ATPase n=1 Tax=Nitratiruptor sp. (strain SB155-2) TaxID=387092 RepID=UPI00015870BE|nr:heavy metal translocating P-type ATPase [Nitratiruptor sp. SB155-2]BAF70559.1 heavy-metal transporting P-type ATPase [Nitratiruptor sp. SB155-2]
MSKIKCDHCHLEFDEKVMIEDEIDGKKHYFCCKGCQGVYHLLRSEGLDSFYDKLGDTKLTPAQQKKEDLEKFDLEGFTKKYVKKRPDGLNEIYLIIEGIHCSACVWLNEKVLHKTPGIIEASINYTNNKAKIVWDPEEIKLSKIIETIRSIGYNAYPYDPKLQEERAVKTRRDYYARILLAVFATMNIMWIAIAKYVGFFTGMRGDIKQILDIAEFALATPTLFYSGWVFFKGAYYGLKNRFINMDFLVATGALLTYIYSIYAMVTRSGEVYFDSVTMIITFVLVGKYLEVLSKKQAVDTIDSLLGSVPTEVVVVQNNEKSLVPVENVEVGDTIEIKAGDKVVIDGVIISGEGSFDESSLTGESEPAYKKEGDEVLSGSILLDSVIRYKATKDFSTSLLANIADLLEDSIAKKPKLEQLANQISGYFSLIILTLALLTFAGWFWYTAEFEKSLIIAVSVIVIACPCALGLATPMATLVGISEALKRGVLFKEASFLETMSKADTLVLDKTGTITKGKPSVVGVELFDPQFDQNIAYTLTEHSNHPISKGVWEYCKAKGYERLLPIKDIKEIKARGLEAVIEGKKIIAGSIHFLREHGIEIAYEGENSLFAIAVNGKLMALYELSDEIREGAAEAVAKIKEMGLEVWMLTGDNEKTAQKVAKLVGIDQVKAKLLPQDKSAFIEKLHSEGRVVIMAGDGINDAIALACSDLAIAMGSGADIAMSVSDVVLLDEKPMKIYESLRLSRRVFLAVKENLTLSLLYNVATIPLAMLGYINPLFAALFMSLSSFTVVGNSMRIKFFKV